MEGILQSLLILFCVVLLILRRLLESRKMDALTALLIIFLLMFLLLSILMSIIKLMQLNVQRKWYLVVCFIVPLFYTTIAISSLYQLIVLFILKIRYRSKFGGFLTGLDALYMSDTSSKYMNYILVLKTKNKLSGNHLLQKIKTVVQNMQKFTKFNSRLRKSLGYWYMVKEELTVESCVNEIESFDNIHRQINVDNLLDLCERCFNLPELPEERSVPWKFFVGKKYMNSRSWKDDETNNYYYPVLFKCKNALGNSALILSVVIKLLSGFPSVEECIEAHFGGEKRKRTCKTILNKFYTDVIMFILLPASFISNYVLKGNEQNYWGGRTLDGREIFELYKDDYRMQYFKINEIKEQFNNFHLLYVLLCLISASVEGHIDSFIESKDGPDSIPTILPVDPCIFKDICRFKRTNRDIEITNAYCPFVLELPLRAENEGGRSTRDRNISEFGNRMRRVLQQSESLTKAAEYELTRFLCNVFGTFLPSCLLARMTKLVKCLINVSIIAGPEDEVVLNDNQFQACLSDIIAFAPNTRGTGISYSMVKYNKTLHIGVAIDTSLINSHELRWKWEQNDLTTKINTLINHLGVKDH